MNKKGLKHYPGLLILCLLVSCITIEHGESHRTNMEFIIISDDRTHFVGEDSGRRFTPWGFNYDHDYSGRLIEDYWHDEWDTVVEDFREMKQLGANVVRIHLQIGRFMKTPTSYNEKELRRLADLIDLAERVVLYLDLTGLGCYHKQDVPSWYDEMEEPDRWAVQALFWEAVAEVCQSSPAIFCYDLMNEPTVPGAKKDEIEWLTGNLGGKFFVQRITLDLAGRTREEIAKAWVDRLVNSIRKHDQHHLITVGAIPWAAIWPNVKPFFYSEQVGENLDFVSVHFYPKAGEVDKALKALAVYDIGKPLVIEEMFPLHCSMEELAEFIHGSKESADGWIGFYWGKTIEEYAEDEPSRTRELTSNWLKFFKENGGFEDD